MGFLFNNVCYPDMQTANTAECSLLTKSSIDSSGQLVQLSCFNAPVPTFPGMLPNGNGTYYMTKYTDGIFVSQYQVPASFYPECLHDGGVTLAYDYFLAAITFLCIVWGGKKLIQLFDNHHADS